MKSFKEMKVTAKNAGLLGCLDENNFLFPVSFFPRAFVIKPKGLLPRCSRWRVRIKIKTGKEPQKNQLNTMSFGFEAARFNLLLHP